jgi:hypothetical protein
MHKTLPGFFLFQLTSLVVAGVLMPFGSTLGGVGFMALGCGSTGMASIPIVFIVDSDVVNRAIDRMVRKWADKIREERESN